MAYVDPSFNINIQEMVVGGGPHNPLSLGTNGGTGTSTTTYIQSNTGTVSNGVFLLPRFIKPTAITNVQVYALGAASGVGISGLVMYFTTLNSTATITTTDSYGTRTLTGINVPFATVNVGTSTIGQMYLGTMASNTVGSNGATTNPAWFTGSLTTPVMVVVNTGTATASVLGSYCIDFEYHNLFVN